MFKTETLFIIGAGASCEAGLPSGEGLKTDIARLLDIRFEDGWSLSKGDYEVVRAIKERVKLPSGQAGNGNPYYAKGRTIAEVVPTTAISIDNYLDAHRGDKEMELCGKLGIIKAILDAEKRSSLCARGNGDDSFRLNDLAGSWYLGFFQMLTENVTRAEVESVFENVSIITFNYDRCIERFLVQAMRDYYQLQQVDAEKIVSSLTIWHPYGSVGTLPWQNKDCPVPFGTIPQAGLLPLVDQVKTFCEGMEDEQLLAGRELVENADTIVFLGFAFHPMNMKLLSVEQSFATRVFGTTLGLSNADEAVILDDIRKMLNKTDILQYPPPQNGLGNLMPSEDYIEPELIGLKCGEFFKHYFRSISADI